MYFFFFSSSSSRMCFSMYFQNIFMYDLYNFTKTLWPLSNVFRLTHKVSNVFQDVISERRDLLRAVCCRLSMKIIIYNIQKSTKDQNPERRWKMTQKIQEFTKHKQVRRQKSRVDKLKSLTKKKRNVQKKKLIDT